MREVNGQSRRNGANDVPKAMNFTYLEKAKSGERVPVCGCIYLIYEAIVAGSKVIK